MSVNNNQFKTNINSRSVYKKIKKEFSNSQKSKQEPLKYARLSENLGADLELELEKINNRLDHKYLEPKEIVSDLETLYMDVAPKSLRAEHEEEYNFIYGKQSLLATQHLPFMNQESNKFTDDDFDSCISYIVEKTNYSKEKSKLVAELLKNSGNEKLAKAFSNDLKVDVSIEGKFLESQARLDTIAQSTNFDDNPIQVLEEFYEDQPSLDADDMSYCVKQFCESLGTSTGEAVEAHELLKASSNSAISAAFGKLTTDDYLDIVDDLKKQSQNINPENNLSKNIKKYSTGKLSSQAVFQAKQNIKKDKHA